MNSYEILTEFHQSHQNFQPNMKTRSHRKRFDIVSPLIYNPGFHNIAEVILQYIYNHEHLVTCRLVSKGWKWFLDNPRFWLKRWDKNVVDSNIYQSWHKMILNLRHSKLGTYFKQKYQFCKNVQVMQQTYPKSELNTEQLGILRSGK